MTIAFRIVYFTSNLFIVILSKNKNIRDLLEKFSNNSINREELDFLYHSINHNLHSGDLKTWLYKMWDEAPERTHKIRSEEILRAIRFKIKRSSFTPRPKFTLRSKKNIFLISGYGAAVFLGIIIALLYKSNFSDAKGYIKPVYNEIHIPLGSKSRITLSDGTKVWLNAGSTLKYPGKFSDKKREIYLEGEAYFDVTQEENRPFYVNAPELHIKVIGTQFNVKSYPDENTVETTLISGSIEIEARPANKKLRKQLRLEPNQKATFSKLTSELTLLDDQKSETKSPVPIEKIEVEDQVNTEIITSWKDNKLVFSRERFEEIATKLERWYNIQMILEDEKIKNYVFTGTFENETLEQALAALKIASPIEYTIDKNTVIIYSKND